jgi:hypothetical protein
LFEKNVTSLMTLLAFARLGLKTSGFMKSVMASYYGDSMAFPIKVCIVCSEEFELRPDKPGFANRCPECSVSESIDPVTKRRMDADERKNVTEANEARRQAMRELLYRKDS